MFAVMQNRQILRQLIDHPNKGSCDYQEKTLKLSLALVISYLNGTLNYFDDALQFVMSLIISKEMIFGNDQGRRTREIKRRLWGFGMDLLIWFNAPRCYLNSFNFFGSISTVIPWTFGFKYFTREGDSQQRSQSTSLSATFQTSSFNWVHASFIHPKTIRTFFRWSCR